MIVLASRSASRRDMLSSAGIEFVCEPADVDERAIEARLGEASPGDVAVALASEKALAVSGGYAGMLVLGSDSLVEVEGRRFDKPASREEAARHLRFFAGRIMRLHSAASLARDGEVIWQSDAMASLHVIDMSEEFIERYLDREWPEVSACVGVFRIEARGVQLFERIEGDYFTILGMPLLKVLAGLRQLGELTS